MSVGDEAPIVGNASEVLDGSQASDGSEVLDASEDVVVLEEDDVVVLEEDDVLVLEEVVESLELPVWEPTGEPRVDDTLDHLTRLDPDDIHQHAGVFDDIHQRLRGTLSDLDTTV